jgi:hypothetical protein
VFAGVEEVEGEVVEGRDLVSIMNRDIVEKTNALFSPLWSDVDSAQTFPSARPLLAHYTSMANLERILSTNQIWFSNPLYMNDWEPRWLVGRSDKRWALVFR